MNFQRYLSAKRTVDDRALNRRVEERLAAEIEERFDGTDRDRLRILEVGAGIGASVERLLARPWLPDRVTYTALDVNPENIAAARERLPARAAALGYAVRRARGRGERGKQVARGERDERGGRFVCSRGSRRVEIDFRAADAFEFLSDADREWDLLVAHAFADLVEPRDALSAFRRNLAPDGLAYCPITFDGGTMFEPVADREFENRLCEAFHRHLDQSGDSRAGRRLLSLASDRGDSEALAVGGSDWVVHPRDRRYPADEAYFLQCIVEMVESAVREDPSIPNERLAEWVARRRDQIRNAELVYCAHQFDLLLR